MRENIVGDEINRAVNCNSQTNRERNRIEKRFFGENYQTNRSRRKNSRKQIVEFKPAFPRNVMSLMNTPQNAVKKPAMNGIGKNLQADETQNC